MGRTGKAQPMPASTEFDLIFAKLQSDENAETIKVNEEISRQTETIRLLREATGDLDAPPFVTYYA